MGVLLRLSPPFKLCLTGHAAERVVRSLFDHYNKINKLNYTVNQCMLEISHFANWVSSVVLGFYQHVIASTVAPPWGDTTTTDQSETTSEAPSTPVSRFPAQLRTPRANGGGKKHQFTPKTVRLYTYCVSDLDCMFTCINTKTRFTLLKYYCLKCQLTLGTVFPLSPR